ncbi:hypothetical protein MKW94_026699 [Papaver nudicaule]|uniref:Uncharacterized protein n=1 Tax=Papaver nudicaule TaxID=74823 RepID=A0AA41UYH0_PAPNU|nr:hypothetical protein [Papaver nudicaule]
MEISLILFQQLTVMVLHAPYLFQVVGFGTSASLTYTAIIGGANVTATIISIVLVSQGCRRFFLIVGGVQIFIMLGIMIYIKLGGMTGPFDMYDYLIITTTCICVAGFAWLWGSTMRPKFGFNYALTAFRFITFVFPVICMLIQVFCHIYLSPLFVVIMTFHAYDFIPNTNRMLSEEDASKVWKQHWFWRRYFVDLENNLMAGEDVSKVWKHHSF